MDLLCGLGPQHIRQLCGNPLDGGLGQSLESVANMTLDQILMLLADPKILRGSGKTRKSKMSTMGGGEMKGRTIDGKTVTKKIGGKSVVRQLMEKREAEQKQEKLDRRAEKKQKLKEQDKRDEAENRARRDSKKK